MKYTQDSTKVNNEINKHIKIIVKEVKKELKDNLISLVLAGGLARGEGSIEVIKERIIPINDYDVYAITKKPVSSEILNKISINATKRFGFKSNFSFTISDHRMNFYVDLRNLTINSLKKVEPMVKYYEIKHSGKIIYGKDVRSLIPDYKLKNIPLQEGMRFLFNRMSLLIECFKPRFPYNEYSYEEKKAVIYYIIKNYLTIAEALLLLSKKFVPSYKKRAVIFKKTYKNDFPELYKEIPDLADKIIKYTELKLRPNFELDIKTWFTARDDMFKVTRYYLKKAFQFSENDILKFPKKFKRKIRKVFLRDYLKYYLKNKFGINFGYNLFNRIAQLYLNLIYFKRLKKAIGRYYFKIFLDTTDPGLKLYSAAPLILFSIEPNKAIYIKLLDNAVKQLSKIYPAPKLRKDNEQYWEDVAKYYADAFRPYQFLKA
ncbi:MAG: hypothetical protein AB1571_03645 [Nanoarchaeota archaeon]